MRDAVDDGDRYLDRFPHAVGALATFALDQLVIDNEEAGGCCPTCCGPCVGLSSLLALDILDDLIRKTGDMFLGAIWWDDVEQRVDRDFLVHAWRRTDCHEVTPDPRERARQALEGMGWRRPEYLSELDKE